MIVWGWGRRNVELGAAGTGACAACQKEQPFKLLLSYQFFRLYWLFGMVTSKQYLRLCTVCGKGQKVEAQQVEPNFKPLPIPFMQRYGLLTFGAVVLVVVAMVAMFGGH
jgi:hypothetical protein